MRIIPVEPNEDLNIPLIKINNQKKHIPIIKSAIESFPAGRGMKTTWTQPYNVVAKNRLIQRRISAGFVSSKFRHRCSTISVLCILFVKKKVRRLR